MRMHEYTEGIETQREFTSLAAAMVGLRYFPCLQHACVRACVHACTRNPPNTHGPPPPVTEREEGIAGAAGIRPRALFADSCVCVRMGDEDTLAVAVVVVASHCP